MSVPAEKLASGLEILKRDGIGALYSESAAYLVDESVMRLVRAVPQSWYLSRCLKANQIRARASDRAVRYADPETVTVTAEACKRPLPAGVESYTGRYQFPESYVAAVDDAFLDTSSMLLTERGEPILSTAGDDEWFYNFIVENNATTDGRLRLLTRGAVPTVSDEVDVGFDLVRHGSYYHWVTECLPDLRALETYDERTDSSIPVLIENDPPGFVVDYLSLLGLDDRITPIQGDTASVGTLMIPERRVRRRHCFQPSTENLEWVRNRYLDAVPDVDADAGHRIYVSREDAGQRNVTNEEALIDSLSTCGFEKYVLTDLDIREQIELFGGADCVVGVHGAGLTNTIFSSDIKVFEIIPESFYWHDFYCLSEQLGFEYDYCYAEPAEPTGRERHDRSLTEMEAQAARRDIDVTVDVETVVRRVKSLLGE